MKRGALLTLCAVLSASTAYAQSVTITSPANGATVSGTITVSATNSPSTDYLKWYGPMVSGACVAPFSADQGSCTVYTGGNGSFSFNTTELPNGATGIYVQEYPNVTSPADAAAIVDYTVQNGAPPPTGTPSSSPSLSPTPSATPTACVARRGHPCPTVTPTPTSTVTPTATPTASATVTTTPTSTPTKSASPTPTTSASPTPTSSASGTPVPGSAADFLNSMGVDEQYIRSGVSPAQELQMIQYLGVKHVREDFMCGDPEGCTGFGTPIQSLVANGQQGGYTFVTQPNCGPNGAQLNSGSISFDILVDQSYGNTLYALGACNEPNNQPYFWNGTGCFENGTAAGCVGEQQAFYTAAKATFPNLPVFSQPEAGGAEPDDVGNQFVTAYQQSLDNGFPAGGVLADYADTHNYASYQEPNGWIPNTVWTSFELGTGGPNDGMTGEYCGQTFGGKFPATTSSDCANIPRVATENGWYYDLAITSEAQRGMIDTDIYAIGYMRGWKLTSLYLLYSGSSANGGGGDPFTIFYDSAGPQTPAPTDTAFFIQNLTTILADPIANFTPSCPNVQPSGANDPSDHWMTLAKSNGKCDFVFVPDRPTGNDVETVTIPNSGNIYDITQGPTPVGTGSSFTANDHIMIVEF